MDQIISKVGSFWVGQKATNELSSVGDDINSLGSSIGDSTKKMMNKVKAKMQKPLPELLKECDLPAGIFPKDATHYEFNEQTKKLTVYIPDVCEVSYRDQSQLRFFTTVTGFLEKGKLTGMEGLKTKVMIWVKVNAITCEESKLHFAVGLTRTRDRAAYEVVRIGIVVDNF
ncbi:hypothetical protein Cgig2_020368 [Carnegiea gigantea]|uniref:Uncharacterized protein n=1 Tax=Carnegiea gigantea TaxID=171969 RepID=A0A9Q1KE01_9CARY|nr:hypothetical protein Cgig2_020368 [Carnegiea gigantea]